ncbi:amidase signature domain-containing protein [Suillus subluteus]|nr:amidase signature domain-containing protein [Suillus subluteus]
MENSSESRDCISWRLPCTIPRDMPNRDVLSENVFPDLHFTSVDLVKAYLARIDEVNLKGAALHAVIETNPKCVISGRKVLIAERESKGSRGPLHGIPLLLKDNIATLHEEGSYALLGSVVPRDAFVAAKLREAGAILLGKANLSEWANYRGKVPSGFSGRGGQTLCPYYPNGDASGSSSGSGVSMAVGLAAGSLGSETDGSIVSPSSKNNVVGIKPTVGLVSRAGVIPISSHQDTTGPMCRSVTDAALLLSVIAGPDPRDAATLQQPGILPDYMKALDLNALKGKRLGVPRTASLDTFRALGAEIVDPADFPSAEEMKQSQAETLVLKTDFKVDVAQYISGLLEVPTGVKNLADLIEFNNTHADLELIPPYHDDQSRFIDAEATEKNDAYYAALAEDFDLGRRRGIDATLQKFNLDAIILPTDGIASQPAAISGYPIISVPLGFQPDNIQVLPVPAAPLHTQAPGLPFGIAFIGTAYSEFNLIGFAYAFEQATQVRLKRRAYAEAIPTTQIKDVISI